MKKLLVIAGLMSVFTLTSCGSAEESEVNNSDAFKIISEYQMSVGRIKEAVHIETGCHYMIVTGDGKAVTQMLNPDGKPYCD